MTQESPQRICYNCRQPMSRVYATVRGEQFCDDDECTQAAAAYAGE